MPNWLSLYNNWLTLGNLICYFDSDMSLFYLDTSGRIMTSSPIWSRALCYLASRKLSGALIGEGAECALAGGRMSVRLGRVSDGVKGQNNAYEQRQLATSSKR